MKSRGFSPDAHYFKYVAKRYSWLALISLVLIGFHTWAGWFLFSWDTVGAGYIMSGTTGEYFFGGNIREIVSFCIINYDAELGMTLPYFSAIIAVVYALVLFSFLWKKNECFTTLSFGVAPKKQFLIRYLFGAGLMTICDAASFGLSYAIHIEQIGGDTTGLTISYSLCYFAVYILLELCIYSIASLIAILSGRFIDYLISIGGILAAPYAIGNMLRHIFANFLQGSALGLARNDSILGSSQFEDFCTILTHSDKFGAFTAFDDVLYGRAIPASGDPTWLKDMVIEAYREEFITLPWTPFFLMLAATLITAFFAYIFFVRRPAEYAGKAGIYPPVYITAAIFASIGISSFVGELALNRYLLTLLICAAFAIAFFIIISVYKASIRTCFEHYRSAIGGVSALLLCVMICFFGAFGYSEYVPKADQIESAVINYIGNPQIYSGENLNIYTSGINLSYTVNDYDTLSGSVTNFSKLSFWTRLRSMPVITDKDDIEAVREIHKYVINSGMKTRGDCKPADDTSDSVIKCDFYIVYTLKDGSTVVRYYTYLTLDAIEKVNSIETSKTFEDMYLNNRLGPGATIYKSGITTFEAADEFFSDVLPLDMLTTEQNDALFEALVCDFLELSYEGRYFSDDRVLGVLRFAPPYNINESGTIYYIDSARKPEDSDDSTWYVTEKYTRTLRLLEEWGITSVFDGKIEILDVQISEFDPYLNGFNKDGNGSLFLIQSYDYVLHTAHSAPMTALPESEWEDYVGRSRAIAATTRGGTFVQITYKNSSGETKIIDRLIPNE